MHLFHHELIIVTAFFTVFLNFNFQNYSAFKIVLHDSSLYKDATLTLLQFYMISIGFPFSNVLNLRFYLLHIRLFMVLHLFTCLTSLNITLRLVPFVLLINTFSTYLKPAQKRMVEDHLHLFHLHSGINSQII